ncbi:MAG: hypothetical protein JSU94_08380 [Phycisphaerales bacterium]|nr:MAG: hypothetical protein JSU94_08380 [Phycisphaerales bacterium]
MNKRKPTKIVPTLAVVAMAIAVLATASADARIVVEEQFIYEPVEANIDGQNGGIGFDGPWVSSVSHGRIYWIRSPGLSFSTLPVAGNALSRYGSAGRAQAHRLLSDASRVSLTGDNTTVWFSVLFQAPSAHRYAAFLFGTYKFSTQGSVMLGDGDEDRNPPYTPVDGQGFGFTLTGADGTSDGGGTINALAFNNSSAPTVVAGAFNPGTETSLIVAKINWKPDGAPDELFLFNITDLASEPSEAAAIVSITNLVFNQSAFNTVAMWDTNNAIFDEIRFGHTFADVTGVLDPNLPSVDAGRDVITWSGEPVTLDPNVVIKQGSGWTDLTYAWSAEPSDGVEFSDPDAFAPTVTIAKSTDNPSVVTLTLAVNNEGRTEPPVTDAMTIELYDDSCLAAKAVGSLELDPTDIDGNCNTDFKDFALMDVRWLDDYVLIGPIPE